MEVSKTGLVDVARPTASLLRQAVVESHVGSTWEPAHHSLVALGRPRNTNLGSSTPVLETG